MGAEGRYTALGLLKGCKTDAGTGVVMWAAGEGMGLSAAGGIFLAEREYCVGVSSTSANSSVFLPWSSVRSEIDPTFYQTHSILVP